MPTKKMLSFVLPCRDEEETIAECINTIKKTASKYSYEIIVVDNSSSDSSASIARKLSAKVVREKRVGYGSALLAGFSAAKGEIIVMADADGTYDFSEFPKLVSKLSNSDIVLGSRMKGEIKKGAMPFIRRYIGNPVLSGILNLFFNSHISDPQTGFRAFRKKTIEKLTFRTTGMEFASEMLINAIKKGMRISEVPIKYYPRKAESKLRPISDGWRHLRFMLMYSPTYLFIIPGAIIFLIGLFLLVSYLAGASSSGVLGSLLSILGYQIINIGLYAKTYAIISGFTPHDPIIDFTARHFPLERTILLGGTIFLSALILGLWAVRINAKSFPIAALTFLILGIQTVFSGFFLSIMLVEKK
ncbi:dolichol-P-glucose synthetase [Candidatus Woesearchaeota archaeon CG07_land_8_20_14_0_80_44_23]|nr:MAG: dolichol-P-glucose synthetase [Candidatus Woesearchaeota archaeon CG07_land_8_20_14_0_80_44_23]